MKEEPLAQCPSNKRNCVCSVDLSNEFSIAPFRFHGPAPKAFKRLKELLEKEAQYKIVSETPTYLHAEYRTRWLRFIDDLEFQIKPEADLIHVRSASRVGYSDLGANRRRLESLRTALNQSLDKDSSNSAP